jgi:pSer/pThr/pTyr-binding forkhead associated (FHA) protein
VTRLMFVEATPMRGRRIPLADGITVGRGDCDVVVVDPEVSRRHAVIRDGPRGPAIHDLGSTNGTFVNDTRIAAPHELRDGDVVRLGNTVWHVTALPEGRGAATRTMLGGEVARVDA